MPRYTIKLEDIGNGKWNKSRAWVARICGLNGKFRFARKFVRPLVDYSLANSVGSRGIFKFYFLVDGIYEISSPLSWNRTKRYFLKVGSGDGIELSLENVVKELQCQKCH